jgi:hypothetical protein
MGLEPTPGPWQGPVLPLYYDRPKHKNSNTIDLAATRSARLGNWLWVHVPKHGFEAICDWESTPNLSLLIYGGLPDLQHTRSLNDGGLPLAIGKFDCLGAVSIHASEPFAILVKDGDLPVLVFAPLVFPELRTLSCGFRFRHSLRLSQSPEPRASTDSGNTL